MGAIVRVFDTRAAVEEQVGYLWAGLQYSWAGHGLSKHTVQPACTAGPTMLRRPCPLSNGLAWPLAKPTGQVSGRRVPDGDHPGERGGAGRLRQGDVQGVHRCRGGLPVHWDERIEMSQHEEISREALRRKRAAAMVVWV